MEVIDIKLTKKEPRSKICYLKEVSRNARLIIKGNLESKDETFLSFKDGDGKEIRNRLNRFALNKCIYIPDWVKMVYIESSNIRRDILFNLSVVS